MQHVAEAKEGYFVVQKDEDVWPIMEQMDPRKRWTHSATLHADLTILAKLAPMLSRVRSVRLAEAFGSGPTPALDMGGLRV